MRISACQMVSGLDPEQNVLDAVNLVAASAESGAELVVLPENFALLADDPHTLKIAEAYEDGPIQETLRVAAVRHHVWIVAGSIPLRTNNSARYTNTSLVFDPSGNIVVRYDRIHLFRLQNQNECYDERLHVEPGDRPTSFKMTTWDGETLKVGLSLGFDLRFPELFRGLAEPDMIVLPATFTAMTGRAHWATLLAARAIENQCFVAAAAQGGRHECGRCTWGHSRIIDPWGNTVSELAEGKGIVIGNIDLSQIQSTRAVLPALTSRTIY